MTPTPHRYSRAVLWLALFLTALVYIGTLRYGFVYDDFFQIVDNPFLHWRFVSRYFLGSMWGLSPGNPTNNYYRPLYMFWFFANSSIFHLNTIAWHALTVGAHLLATYLVYRLGRRVLSSDLGAAIAALIFGLHPMHIESVAWISGVSDSLMAAAVVGSVLAWANFRERTDRVGKWCWFGASAGLAAVALLIKESGVATPALIAVYEFWIVAGERPWRDRWRSGITALLPFAALDAAYLGVRKIVFGHVSFVVTAIPLKVMVFTLPSVAWFYIQHLLWPVGLSEFYDTPYITAATRDFWLPLLGVLAAGGALVYASVKSKSAAVPFAAVWLAVPILPAFNLRGLKYADIAHDRYLYLSSVAFAFLLAHALTRLKITRSQLLGLASEAAAALLGIVIFFSAATASQSAQFANELLLYSRGVEIAPNNGYAVSHLANEFLRRNRPEDAVPLFERCTRIAPGDWMPHYVLGYTLLTLHRYEEAERALLAAIALNPNDGSQYYFLGRARLEDHRPQEAEQPLRRAIELMPAARGAHEALADVLIHRGEIGDARAELLLELKIDPQNATARQTLQSLADNKRLR